MTSLDDARKSEAKYAIYDVGPRTVMVFLIESSVPLYSEVPVLKLTLIYRGHWEGGYRIFKTEGDKRSAEQLGEFFQKRAHANEEG